ncbi:MAG TPA: PilZ domain-containing protein [Spirochaetes bacterium]|nr:PilZ domain-containing protein [Spirochaetota bacterium]
MQYIFILFFLFVLGSFLFLWFRGWQKPFPWLEFYKRGKYEGFTLREIILLKRTAVYKKLEKPLSIFWSVQQLNRCLYTVIHDIDKDESLTKKKRKVMLGRFLALRKKAELSFPKYKKKLRTTKDIPPRQKLVIRDKDYGAFISWVIDNKRKALVVLQPLGQEGWKSLNWNGRKIKGHFWNKDDAGYSFETRVLEQIPHEEYPVINLKHLKRLTREQKRDSVRVEISIKAWYNDMFYSTGKEKPKVSIAKTSNSGKIIDISETGCCMIGGRALNENDYLMMKFFLTEKKRVVAVGTVIKVSTLGDKDQRKYHIKFTKIGSNARNSILLYVYNIFGEREDMFGEYSKK